MAENAPDQVNEFLTPHTGITGSFLSFNEESGMYSYVLRNSNSGAEETVESAYPPEDTEDSPGFRSLMGAEFGSEAGQSLGITLANAFEKLRYQDQRGFWKRAIAPVLRSTPAFFAGGFWDIAGLLSYVPDPVDLAMMGYEVITDDTPSWLARGRKGKEAFRRVVAEDYGSEATRKRYQQNLRALDNYAYDHWGFKPFEASIGTDMTPDAQGIWEKMITTGLEFAISGPVMVKGVTLPAKILQTGARFIFSRMAKDSARELGKDAMKPENVRSLIDKANDAYSLLTKQGRRNIKAEMAFGGGSGIFTEASLAALEEVDPDAAGFVKMSVAIGSGLAGPILARGVWTGFIQAPVVNLGTRFIVDPLFRPGTAAARFSLKEGLGTSKAERAGIVSVARILEEAILDGRHVHEASGLAFTTPELARSESNILRAQLELKRERVGQETNPDIRTRLEKEIEVDENNIGYLNRWAGFQESILKAASKDRSPAIVEKFFYDEAQRLVVRREQFFNYIEGTFKKSFDDIDFGGKSGGTPEEIRFDYKNVKDNGATPEFESTRRKLVMEADPKGIESSELMWLDPQTKTRVDGIKQDLSVFMDEALGNAQKAAEDRVKVWHEYVESYLADKGLQKVGDLPVAERKMIGDTIRGTYDDAYREWRAFEKAAYRRVKGLDDKVTENIVFPEGATDSVTGDNIGGMTVGDWATNRLDNLSPTEVFNPRNVPVQLAQLSGMRSVIAQLNRRHKEAVAAGRAGSAQSRIPDLERQRDNAIVKKTEAEAELDAQYVKERVDAENRTRTLWSYVEDATAKLSDVRKQSVVDFASGIGDIDWQNMSAAGARAQAPKGLGAIFVEIARQKKALLALGEGTVSSKAVSDQLEKISKLSEKAQKSQREIDKITGEFLGIGEDVVIPPAGRLTSRDANGNLVGKGKSASDVKEVISDIAEDARRELDANGKTPKYRSQIQLRNVLEQLLSSETFPTLDPSGLYYARQASRLKNAVDDAQGDILGKTKGSEVKVEVEEVATKVLPEAPSPLTRSAKLRVLEQATAELPDFVTIKRGDDGKIVTDAEGIPVAVIDEDAMLGGKSLFDRPDSPFELVPVGEAGTNFEIRIKQNAPVSPRSLEIAESILLERLALRFPDGVDSKSLGTFRDKNREALKFLKDNGRDEVPKMLDDADVLANRLDILNSLRRDKTRNQLTELVKNDQLDLQGLSIDDYLDYIGQRRRRFSEGNAFAEVIKADPGHATEGLFDRILDPGNKQPKTALNEFLSVVRGDRQAERGLQASIIGELFRRSTTRTGELVRITGDAAASAFDPTKFRELMSNPRIRSMIQEAFPDNGEILKGLTDVSVVAFETSNFTKGSRALATALDPQNAVSMEAWGNLGRILGLQVADRIGFINALMAAGAGGRLTTRLGKDVTGNRIKDILIEAAIYPENSVALARKASEVKDGFVFWLKQLAKGMIDTVKAPVTVPLRRPAATSTILRYGEQQRDEYGRQKIEPIPEIIPSAEPPVPPLFPTGGGASLQVPSPREGTRLAQIDPFTMQRGQEVFGPMDRVFAANKESRAKWCIKCSYPRTSRFGS